MESKEETSKMDTDEFENKEWPGIKENKYRISVMRINTPLFIMEVGRLVPFLKGKYVRFFPINMPKIEIGYVYIIGIVLEVSCNHIQYDFIVDDGTGTLVVIYKLKHCDAETRTEDKAQTSKNYPKYDSKDTVSTTENKVVECGKYVHLQGFLSLIGYKQISEKENPLKRLKYCKPVLFAFNIEFISEKQYYEKMDIWFQKMNERYTSM